MSKKNAAAFAIGLGQGYMSAQRRNREEERQAKDDAWREEQRSFERDRQQREVTLQRDIADAAAPRTEIQGTAVDTPAGLTLYKDPAQAQAAQQEAQIEQEMRGGPTLAEVRPAYGVTGTSVGNRITTEKPDVAALNDPDARMGRVIDATMRSDPVKALSLQNMDIQGKAARLGIKKAEEDMEEQRRLRAASVKREGMENTFRALRTRDPQAVFNAFNAQGDTKLAKPPELVGTQKFKTPWGEIDDDVWSAEVIGPDGNARPLRVSTMQVGQQLASISDLLKQEGEAGKIGLEHKLGLEKVERQGQITRDNQTHQGSITRQNQSHQGTVVRTNQAHASANKPPGKPMPSSAAGGLLENQRNLRRAQAALQLISGGEVDGAAGDPNATGLKGFLPNHVLNRMDPKGVDTRAAIADLGSLIVHDRSGAAVTAAEFPRLAPFIPTEKDDPETVRKKLKNFVNVFETHAAETAEFYQSMGYNVPTSALRNVDTSASDKVDGKPSSGGSDLPRVSTPAEAMKLPSGTRFIDANGVTRTRP